MYYGLSDPASTTTRGAHTTGARSQESVTAMERPAQLQSSRGYRRWRVFSCDKVMLRPASAQRSLRPADRRLRPADHSGAQEPRRYDDLPLPQVHALG